MTKFKLAKIKAVGRRYAGHLSVFRRSVERFTSWVSGDSTQEGGILTRNVPSSFGEELYRITTLQWFTTVPMTAVFWSGPILGECRRGDLNGVVLSLRTLEYLWRFTEAGFPWIYMYQHRQEGVGPYMRIKLTANPL